MFRHTAENWSKFWTLSYQRSPLAPNSYFFTGKTFWLWSIFACLLTAVTVTFIDGPVQNYIWDIHSKPWIRFFKWVSWFGKSEWQLLPSGLIILTIAALPISRFMRRRKVFLINLWQMALLVFAPVVTTGIAIQLLKQVIPRPRPLNKPGFDEYDFFPFDFTAGFTSMPSGHTGTVVSSAIVLGLIFPWLRVPLVLGASFVAFS